MDLTDERVRQIVATVVVAIVLFVVAVARIWSDAFGDIGTFLRLSSAGVAIAPADVFLNLAGWFYIVTRHPFRVGDRIEIASPAGDVVDIGVFRFTLMEIKYWVGGDQPTGRLVHVPNGRLSPNGRRSGPHSGRPCRSRQSPLLTTVVQSNL